MRDETESLLGVLQDVERRLTAIEAKLEQIAPQAQTMYDHVLNVEYVARKVPLVQRLFHWDQTPRQQLHLRCESPDP